MKLFIISLVFCIISISSFSQDIIVLKKNEQEVKCRIISISDTSFTYTDWNNKKSEHSIISRNEVLSYLIDTKSRENNKLPVVLFVGISGANAPVYSNTRKNIDAPQISSSSEQKQGLLGIYKNNEVAEGYIVKNEGDTVNGYITVVNVAMNQLQVLFSENTSDSAKIFSTEEVKAYGYGQIQYRKIKSPIKNQTTNLVNKKNEFLFLHLVVEGPSELYRLFTLNFKSAQLRGSSNPPYYSGKLKTYYLITNVNGDSICTKGRTLKGTLNRIYDDNKTVKEYIYKEGVKEDQLPQIVEMYNSSVVEQ